MKAPFDSFSSMLVRDTPMSGSRYFRGFRSSLSNSESRVADADMQKKETLTFDDNFTVSEFFDDLPTVSEVLQKIGLADLLKLFAAMLVVSAVS